MSVIREGEDLILQLRYTQRVWVRLIHSSVLLGWPFYSLWACVSFTCQGSLCGAVVRNYCGCACFWFAVGYVCCIPQVSSVAHVKLVGAFCAGAFVFQFGCVCFLVLVECAGTFVFLHSCFSLHSLHGYFSLLV